MMLFSCSNLIAIFLVLNTISCTPSIESENVVANPPTAGPVFFTEEPVGQRVSEGEEVKLNCTLDNEPSGVKYFWYKYEDGLAVEISLLQISGVDSDKNLLRNDNTNQLVFTSISRIDQGYYQCKVQSGSYTIFSSVAFIEVNYFDEALMLIATQKIEVNAHQDMVALSCATFESSPVVDVFWTKDGYRISNERMFVYPEDYYTDKGEEFTRGTLMIMNVKAGEDSGAYECYSEESYGFPEKLLSSYKVNVDDNAVIQEVDKVLDTVFSSFSEDGGSVEVESGGTVTLVCAAKGNPLPVYEWWSNGEIVRSTESFQVKDFGRRMVLSMVTEDTDFKCIMRNTAKNRRRERQENFYINVKNKTESFAAEFVERVEDSTVKILQPNHYKPFTMECHIEKMKGQHRILWLKNGVREEWKLRDRIDVTEETIGSKKEGVTIHFEIPNESDLGVYQCVVVSSDENAVSVKQQTTYVTLQTESLTLDSRSRLPNYKFLPGPFYVDEAAGACRAINMHLVSILDLVENQIVLELVRNNNVENVWIGLNREIPEPFGTWNWTMPGDSSYSFSNWVPGKPDNRYGRQEYVVLQNDTGKWRDVKRDLWKRPAVCKNYTVTCPSVDKSYKGRFRVRGWELSGTTYHVGQQVEVHCRYPKDKDKNIAHVVTCGKDMKFDELDEDGCLDHDSFFLSSKNSSEGKNYFNHLVLWTRVIRQFERIFNQIKHFFENLI